MGIYTVTDWLGLVPIAVCIGFGLMGLLQWVRRKSIAKVNRDILLLGGYYILWIWCSTGMTFIQVTQHRKRRM